MLFYVNLPVKSRKITCDSWPESAATATKPHKTHKLTKIVVEICSKNIFQLFSFGPLVKNCLHCFFMQQKWRNGR